jgi:hypothetical protein
MIYLTAIELTPGGSSTVHIYTQKIHRTTQSTQTIHRKHSSVIMKSADRVPSLRGIPWHLPYNRGKSAGKPQSGWPENGSWQRIYRISDYLIILTAQFLSLNFLGLGHFEIFLSGTASKVNLRHLLYSRKFVWVIK